MANDIWYSIRNNRIKKSLVKGFTQGADGELILDENELEHSVFLHPLDGVEPGSEWGRLSCELLLAEQIVCYIYVIAFDNLDYYVDKDHGSLWDYLKDPSENSYSKVKLLQQLGAKRFVNTKDGLLYELSGRYLFIALEMIGSGSACVGKMRVGVRGDVFMDTFPAVYHDRNSFFHRYISIFSVFTMTTAIRTRSSTRFWTWTSAMPRFLRCTAPGSE